MLGDRLADSVDPRDVPVLGPRHSSVYGFMFRGTTQFDAAYASISFAAEYLTLPLRRDDRDLCNTLQRPLPLIVLQYRHDRLVSQRTRQLLRTRGLELSNAAALASALNVSTRSLHRRLAEEGNSLQHLKDEARREIAIDQLIRTRKPLKQVAAAAGFRNEASFNRAFRNWTGQSPGQYRQSLTRSE